MLKHAIVGGAAVAAFLLVSTVWVALWGALTVVGAGPIGALLSLASPIVGVLAAGYVATKVIG